MKCLPRVAMAVSRLFGGQRVPVERSGLTIAPQPRRGLCASAHAPHAKRHSVFVDISRQ